MWVGKIRTLGIKRSGEFWSIWNCKEHLLKIVRTVFGFLGQIRRSFVQQRCEGGTEIRSLTAIQTSSGRSRVSFHARLPWFAILSPSQRALVALVVAAIIFLSGGVLDWFVTRQYLPRVWLMLAGAAVSLAVGLLVFQILTDIQKRYQGLLDRLKRIAELNHHIRNALQVIAYNNVPERTGPAIQQVGAEIARIESVLREVSNALGEHPGSRTTAISAANRKRKLSAID